MPTRLLALAVVFALTLGVRAQDGQDPQDRPIFRLSVSLVQLDAVVVDRKGRHVATLGRDDFEVLQDGRPQFVAAATYVYADEPWEDASGLPPLPPEALVSRDARRTIALVVDDLRMSFVSIARARDALRSFVTARLAPSDRVAFVTTSGAPGSSVGFGASPAALRGAVDRLRFSLMQPTTSVLDPISPWPPDAFDVFRERTTADDALRRIQDVVSLVQAQGGRKAVVLVSEGFAPFAPGWEFGGVRDGMRRLIDKANRAGVVIYALDPRGLVVTGLSAADAVSSAQSVAGLAAARGYALRETQDGLRYLSGETGGFAVIDSNDLARGLVRILDDQRGYYLIGYQPEDGTFEAGPERYRRIKVRLKRPGLKVRTRTGFYARPTE